MVMNREKKGYIWKMRGNILKFGDTDKNMHYSLFKRANK